MKIIVLIVLSLVLLLILFLAVYYFYHYYQGYKKSKGVPYLGSFKQQLDLIKQSKLIQPGKNWLDLGSGDGKALRYFTKHLGAKECIGYEINKHAVWMAKIKNKRYGNKNITYHYHNFIAHPGSIERERADVIYLYLFDHVMDAITKILSQHAISGSIVVCNTFPLIDSTDIVLKEERERKGKKTIFIYQKK